MLNFRNGCDFKAAAILLWSWKPISNFLAPPLDTLVPFLKSFLELQISVLTVFPFERATLVVLVSDLKSVQEIFFLCL